MGLFTPDIYKLKKHNRINALVRLLDHKNNDVRYGAFSALSDKTDLLDDEIKDRLRNMMFTDPDPWIKTMATLRFARLGDPSVSRNFLDIIQEGTLKSKLELLRFIADNGPSADVTVFQIIIIGLSDTSILVRFQAITAASSVKNKQLIPHLGEILKDKQHHARLLAAKALYNIDRYESLDYLIQLLADTNLEVLAAVRTYLSAMNKERSNKILPAGSFVTSGNENSTELVYEKTVQGMPQDIIQKALSIVYTAGQDRYRVIRVEALKSIAMFRHQSSIDFVETLLHDRFPEVRIEALHTLEKIGGKRALAVLENKTKDRKKAVRDATEKVLARMKKQAALDRFTPAT
jgi:HEAT repeat protein